MGRITSVAESPSGAGTQCRAAATVTRNFAYDSVGRLQSVVEGGTTRRYCYDPNGNRLDVMADLVTPCPSVVTAPNVYTEQDRLLQYGTMRFGYNASGQLQTKTGAGGTTTFEYDEFTNLTHVDLPGGTTNEIEHIIDGQQRRVGKRVSGVLERRWLYRDQLNPVVEYDSGGNLTQFVYATKPHVPDYMRKGGINYLLVTDHIGSVRLVVNATTGQVAQRLDYDEFGNVLSDSNAGFQPFGFAGGLYDPDTGLVRFGARDYDSEVGRWTAKDPILFGGGQGNLYLYVGNDPVNWIDPEGTSWARAVIAGGAALGRLLAKYGAKAWKAVKRFWRDLDFDGPSPGLRHGNGRVCQVRYKKKPVARLDYHPYPGTNGESRLHGHFGQGESGHVPLDPRSWWDG